MDAKVLFDREFDRETEFLRSRSTLERVDQKLGFSTSEVGA